MQIVLKKTFFKQCQFRESMKMDFLPRASLGKAQKIDF